MIFVYATHIHIFIGIKTLNRYHKRLINLHSQCFITEFDFLRCCTNLRSSQDDMQNICLYYDVHINMNVALIKKNKFIANSWIL